MVRSPNQSLPLRQCFSSRPTSTLSHSQRSLCSKHFGEPKFQSKQTPPPWPRRPYRRLSRRNEWRALLVSFIFRHDFLAAAKDLAHQTFLRHREYLKAVSAPLLQLLHLHIRHLRQVLFGPGVLHKLQRIVLSERITFPIRWQKQPAQIRMIRETNAEQIKYLAFEPVCSRPNTSHALDRLVCANFQSHALIR